MKRSAAPASGGAAADDNPADAAREVRTRARRRLIGAVVLVGVGIIGFPLVFETQPRPVPIDIPIEIPRKDAVPPLAMPPAQPKPPAAAAVEVPAGASGEEIITERRAEAGRELPPPAGAVNNGGPKAPGGVVVPPSPSGDVDARPASAPSRGAPAADGARAQALLEGKDVAKAEVSSRFVVQVGAFAEAAAAQEARAKIERLGIKTYTQVAETPNGSRIRVRLGPFANRDEADRALVKARSAGLGGVVLTL